MEGEMYTFCFFGDIRSIDFSLSPTTSMRQIYTRRGKEREREREAWNRIFKRQTKTRNTIEHTGNISSWNMETQPEIGWVARNIIERKKKSFFRMIVTFGMNVWPIECDIKGVLVVVFVVNLWLIKINVSTNSTSAKQKQASVKKKRKKNSN